MGFEGVFGEVAEESMVLGLVADEVIEGVWLPEATCGAETAVEVGGGEAFPRFALAQHGVTIWKGYEHVKVIGHDDEAMHLVAIAVEVEQAVMHDVGTFWRTQGAGAVAFIE